MGVTLEEDVFFFAPTGLGLDFLEPDADDADFLEVAGFALVFVDELPVANLAFGGAAFLSLETLVIVFGGALGAALPPDFTEV